MALTERQSVIQHLVDKKLKFNDPVDLAIHLRRDQMEGKEIGQKEYVDKLLSSGYRSTLFTSFYDDVKAGAVKPSDKQTEDK